MGRAVFLDKDGVINIDKGISGNLEPVEFFSGVCDLISLFKKRSFMVFIVTNQPVVARGLMSEKKLKEFLEEFRLSILKINPSAFIDKIYYCPHHPDADVERYRIVCECRKPKPGMILEAVKEYNIDINKSFMIGDRISDVTAGRLAGCKTVQFLSGKHLEKSIKTDLKLSEEIRPDFMIKNLSELEAIVK